MLQREEDETLFKSVWESHISSCLQKYILNVMKLREQTRISKDHVQVRLDGADLYLLSSALCRGSKSALITCHGAKVLWLRRAVQDLKNHVNQEARQKAKAGEKSQRSQNQKSGLQENPGNWALKRCLPPHSERVNTTRYNNLAHRKLPQNTLKWLNCPSFTWIFMWETA